MGSSAIKAPTSEQRRDSTKALVIRASLTLNWTCREEKSTEHTVRSMSTNPSVENSRVSFDSFSLLRPIGTGSCSYVLLVRDRTTQHLLVLKLYSKSHLLKSSQLRRVRSELQALELIRSSWVPQFLGCGQDERRLFLAMEFVQGGELFRLMRKVGRFTLREVEFYTAELVCALTDIHAWRFVYRDLKPENVMIAADGHIKVVDFHLAKFLKSDSRTKTLCGTPEYIAPESIERTGHGFEVDWWQLGILIYEMLSSKTPFFDSSPYVLYTNILTSEVKFPGYFDHTACLLISSLLVKQPKKRLSEVQIKAHDFFAETDWARAARQQLTPPLINRVKSQEDDSFFEKFREPEEWEIVNQFFVGF